MTHTAFFAQDRFSHKDTTVNFPQSLLSSPDSPYKNALDDRPRLTWQAPTPGYWALPLNHYLDLNEGSGEISVLLPPATGDAASFATSIQAFLNASSSTTRTYTVSYNPNTSKFTISATGTFSILWSSGTHGGSSGANPRQWLGWGVNPSDTSSATSHEAPEKRFGTELWITFDLGSAKAVDALAVVLEAGEDVDINSTSYSSIRAYGNATDLGSLNRTYWESGAAQKMTFTPVPTETENTIQVAYASDGTLTYRYWAFSYRFFDEDPYHAVGILKALKKYSSTDRQITELSGHGLVDPTRPLQVGNYYPAQDLLHWVAPLNFNAWEAATYRDTVQRVVREGKSKGLLWALRWDKIIDGTHTAQAEADKGFLFWGAITQYSQGSYSGAGSSGYISGELTVEQVR
jgi:hypothetical protein